MGTSKPLPPEQLEDKAAENAPFGLLVVYTASSFVMEAVEGTGAAIADLLGEFDA